VRSVTYRLSVLWARGGWPSEVQQAIRDIPDPWPRHLVVAARCFSPGALEQLRGREANWVDEAGNVHLYVPPGLIVMKEARKDEQKRRPKFAWSPSSASLAELILCGGRKKWTLRELAESSGWSAPQVSNVFRSFDAQEWTLRQGPPRGRHVWWELVHPGALLDAWSAHLAEHRPARKLGHHLMRDSIQFLTEVLAPLLNQSGEWVVTGWAGLELVAPYTNFVPSLQIYVPGDQIHPVAARVFKEAKIRAVEEGGNVEIWELDGPLIAAAMPDSEVRVANLPRLYADLLAIGGRAKDGAAHLRETKLGI